MSSRNGRASRMRVGVVALIGVVLAGSVAGVLGWYQVPSSLVNAFTAGSVDVQIDEQFDPEAHEKRDVAVRVPENDAGVAAYTRARVEVYWQDASGARLWEEPVEKAAAPAAAPQEYDYELTWATADPAAAARWVQGSDGSYYWTAPVAPGDRTGNLVDRCVEQVRFDDGRQLVVEVVVQAIQADPARAFEQAWGSDSGLAVGSDGTLEQAAQAEGERR